MENASLLECFDFLAGAVMLDGQEIMMDGDVIHIVVEGISRGEQISSRKLSWFQLVILGELDDDEDDPLSILGERMKG